MNYTKLLIYLVASSDSNCLFIAKHPVPDAEEIIQNKIEKEEKIFLNDIFKSKIKKTNDNFFGHNEYIQIKKTSDSSYEYFQNLESLICYGILHKFNEHWFDLFLSSNSKNESLNNLSLETIKNYKKSGFSSQIILFKNIPLKNENLIHYINFCEELENGITPNVNIPFQEKIKYNPLEKNNLSSDRPELDYYKEVFKKEFTTENLSQLNSNLSNIIFDFFNQRKLKLHLILN